MRRHPKASTAGSDRQKAAKFALPVSLFAALLALLVVVGIAAAATSPEVTTDPVSNNTGTRATLNGKVNPQGVELSECKFEYGESFTFNKVVPCVESNATIGTGTSPVSVHADVSNLKPNGQLYAFRLVAKNPETAAVTAPYNSFNTPDTVVTTAASGTTSTTTTLNGTVNPDTVAITECVFEWGSEEEGFGIDESTLSYPNTAPCVPGPGGIGSGTSPVAVSANLTGLHQGTVYHYRLKAANANGPILGKDLSVETAGPRIVATWSEDVVYSEASLHTEISPEGSATTYHFEYGTSTAYGSQTPELPVGSDSSSHEMIQLIQGLAPGTTYHYRVVATSSAATNEGPDRTFTTYAHEPLETSCANQVNRYGAGAHLADCRAYEMVSPIDKHGGDIVTRCNISCVRGEFQASSVNGEKFTYSANGSFGDAVANLYTNQYLATRGADGWSTHGISPAHEAGIFFPFNPAWDFDSQFKDFSADLSETWITDDAEPPLTQDAVTGEVTLYRRNNLTDGYQPLWTSPPTSGSGELGRFQVFEGRSADSSHVLFSIWAAFTPDAAPGEGRQLYDYTGGSLHLVSILPSNTAATQQNGLGAGDARGNETGHVSNAVSRDGSKIYWTNSCCAGGDGEIYVRVNGTTTYPVSEGVPGGAAASYLTASTDGSKALFSVSQGASGKKDLYMYDLASKSSSLVTENIAGVMGTSDDLSKIYVVSREALDAGATTGKKNLYLDDNGDFRFITTVPSDETASPAYPGFDLTSESDPFYQVSRVSPDGRVAAFQSRGDLTGYDKTNTTNGEPTVQVYLYEADADVLHCVSCRPSGARPLGKELQEPYSAKENKPVNDGAGGPGRIWTAAWLTTSRHITYAPHTLSSDGNRLFFNAFDALLPQDTNGQQDVYEWESQGTGGCTKPAGCLSLISSGTSAKKSEFIDATPDGGNVFFATESSLVPQDPGLIDIYDAHEGGGYPPLPPPPPPCVGDACQHVPPAPNDATPASAAFRGAGDPHGKKARPRCKVRKRASKAGKQAERKRVKRCRRASRRASR